ncbi:putative reverse transcriptase domain-containing protein [Tanacetum coccineum]
MPSKIRSFLGLASYYRCFIENFSKIAKPITSLTQKNHKYKWGEKEEEAFHTLKNNLCDAPILLLPDRIEDFVVYYDASNQGLGCVLMQRGKENVLAKRLHGLDEHMERKEDGSLYFTDRIWVPLVGDVRMVFLNKPHMSRYSVHLGADKMYHNPRYMYWWLGMKKDIAIYVNGQSERIIQTLDDMLRGCIINFGGSWDVHLPLAKFSYNNSYHSSIRCALFEALYGRKYRSPVLWAEIGEGSLIGLELLQETTDKVSPWKGIVRFRKKGKLAPRYVGLFEILERIDLIAYRLRLPEELNSTHDTFHVSNLKKCLA